MGSLRDHRSQAKREARDGQIRKTAIEEWERKALETFTSNYKAVDQKLNEVVQEMGGFVPWSSNCIEVLLERVAHLKQEIKGINDLKALQLRYVNALEGITINQEYTILAQIIAMACLVAKDALNSTVVAPKFRLIR